MDGVVSSVIIEDGGNGYSSAPQIRIASPPDLPRLSIRTLRVAVDLKLTLGRRYQLLSSPDLAQWAGIGEPFVAEEEEITREFDVTQTGQYFKAILLP